MCLTAHLNTSGYSFQLWLLVTLFFCSLVSWERKVCVILLLTETRVPIPAAPAHVIIEAVAQLRCREGITLLWFPSRETLPPQHGLVSA